MTHEALRACFAKAEWEDLSPVSLLPPHKHHCPLCHGEWFCSGGTNCPLAYEELCALCEQMEAHEHAEDEQDRERERL